MCCLRCPLLYFGSDHKHLIFKDFIREASSREQEKLVKSYHCVKLLFHGLVTWPPKPPTVIQLTAANQSEQSELNRKGGFKRQRLKLPVLDRG